MNGYWQKVNRDMVAKILAELEYERTLSARQLADNRWQITMGAETWQFQATRGIWGWLHIDPESLTTVSGNAVDAETALLQLATVLEMSDAQTAEHLEDLYATLRGDIQLLQARETLDADALIHLDPDELQCLMSGHPKFIFNKGRRGWGLNALRQYAPEYRGRFRLHWVAVQRAHLVWSSDVDCDINTLLASAMDNAERARFDARWQGLDLDDNWLPVPLHPWQWQQKIAVHFLAQLARGEMVELGEFGDEYLAQQSLRTLTNASRRTPFDIKLPLTIYNTSCYRGIPGKYIAAGPLASRWLQQQFASDATLIRCGAQVLGEPAAGYLSHPGYAALPKAPYRYQEMLGVIWRENPSCYLQQGEEAVLMAALMESDNTGRPLIDAWIAQSGLTAEAWLEKLFDATVIPFYHLLCRYGVALIAHGQNVTLVMKDAIPQRILLKDFQGDMRLVDEDFPQAASLPEQVKSVTARLSADYIIHDLQTGNFVTVLRFISRLTLRSGVSETRFYQILAEVLRRYMAAHPDLAERFAKFDLFKQQIIRVILNPVKLTFSEHDGGSRMLPNYVTDLDNPLFLVSQESAQ
ncbi:aerobactin synthase IucC [Enterobacter ludwigii]|uniref:IucA/IucC family protein n=1 Tax=Enterobacter cloacae complex TaxID=354276 RepID=UPI0009212192|nr:MULTISPECIES: IucA/IucC family siderophore biosynthesis protein [Enterobacter cloacae complex]AWC85838.1 IucA/IucC family siderophore biosynthesis protein [Enterobacter cloacae complex sp. FDA-CDC-AR_0164]SHL96855.1 aerobactin synthase [Enterobacter ludwigii]